MTTWKASSPQGASFGRLDIYGSFFNRTLEVSAGIHSNIATFIGIFAGGNPLLANGLGGTIPIQVGLSGGVAPAPTFFFQLNGKHGLYSKTGIQRSIDPRGLAAEAQSNGIGLQLTRRGTRPLVIQEFGLRRAASAEDRQIWLRAGYLKNETDYTRFDGRGTSDNWMLYALADYQVVQPSKQEPYRGVFIGATVMTAPGSVNVYRRTYEARVYGVGMVPGRGMDAMTLTFGYNDFSQPAGDALAAAGQVTQPHQWSIGLLYAAHVTRGIYLAPSVTYLKNPSFVGDFKPALNFSLGTTLIF